LTCQLCNQSSVILLESSSARDGPLNGQPFMADLGVLKFDRVFARLAFFCHPATGRRTTGLSTLQSKLCDIARVFLCARWPPQRQADQVGQRWYEAAIRNQARVPHGRLSGESGQPFMADLGVLKFDRVFARLAFFCHPATVLYFLGTHFLSARYLPVVLRPVAG
jgi:hypothetical protein